MPLPIDYIPTGACVPFEQSVDQTVIDAMNDVKALVRPFTDALSDSCSIMSSIGNLVQAGVDQVKNALKAIGNVVGAVINTLMDLFSNSILDTMIGAIGAIIGGIIGAVKSVMNAVMTVIDQITDMLVAAIQGVKDMICDIIEGGVKNLPKSVMTDPVLSSVKDTKIPATGNVAFANKDMAKSQVSRDILNKSGYPTKANEILGLEKTILGQVDILNSTISNVCGGKKITVINKKGLIPALIPSAKENKEMMFDVTYNIDFINDDLNFVAFSDKEYTYDWSFKFNKQSEMKASTRMSGGVPFKYSFLTADKFPLEVTVTAKSKDGYKTIKHKFDQI
jgi:phage-related protein